MLSRIADAIEATNQPVALLWSKAAPEGAVRFRPGKWGCVMSVFATVARKGKTGVFDRETYGCWGGGVGLGFGNCYETFPGGVECFCGFLAQGNEHSETGRRIGEALASGAGKRLADDFLLGERYLKSAEATRRFLDMLPMRDVPAPYVVLKPLSAVDPEKEEVQNVTFFVEPDALSALVVLANFAHPERENVGIPFTAGCQVIGILSYREAEREHPRALVGLTDISARQNTRASLGRHSMSFTVPWGKFLEMEENVESSFFRRETWKTLRSD